MIVRRSRRRRGWSRGRERDVCPRKKKHVGRVWLVGREGGEADGIKAEPSTTSSEALWGIVGLK